MAGFSAPAGAPQRIRDNQRLTRQVPMLCALVLSRNDLGFAALPIPAMPIDSQGKRFSSQKTRVLAMRQFHISRSSSGISLSTMPAA